MAIYSDLQSLRYNATFAKYNQLETMQEDFRLARKSFNIALVDFLQNEFSDNVQLKESFDSGSFTVIVSCTYWSEYRQQKLDDLFDTLKDLCKSIEVVPEFVADNDDDTKDIKSIFKVTANHRY